jgi:uncharacterized protein (DUF1810 family)
MPQLERFRRAQDSQDSGFEAALGEIRSGRKRGHWIWYVFPQLAGLGTSAFSQAFGIDGESEATAYLHDAVLRTRLLEIVTAVAETLRVRQVSLRELMGSDLDARKVVSSLTLFGQIAKKLYIAENEGVYSEFGRVTDEVLTVARSEGFPPCAYTLQRISHGVSH